jgi:hypothetical protein
MCQTPSIKDNINNKLPSSFISPRRCGRASCYLYRAAERSERPLCAYKGMMGTRYQGRADVNVNLYSYAYWIIGAGFLILLEYLLSTFTLKKREYGGITKTSLPLRQPMQGRYLCIWNIDLVYVLDPYACIHTCI